MTERSQVNLRLTAAQREALSAAAERCGLPLSEWARLVLVAASGDEALRRSLRAAAREQALARAAAREP